ncbi:hypothetical protein B0H11DRAFT_2246358 [Mycena galericulata]|nr:hypothetical protein B0H11DRAFT_2246358 [Mycena galericulata]
MCVTGRVKSGSSVYMLPFEDYHHFAPSQLCRMLFECWVNISDACSDLSQWDNPHSIRTTLIGEVVVAPEEMRTAVMRVGRPDWRRDGWPSTEFISAFSEQSRALSFIHRIGRRWANAEGTPPPSVSTSFENQFDVQLLPETVCTVVGRHSLFTNTPWEEISKPFRVGDTVIIAATLDVNSVEGLVVTAVEVQMVFSHRVEVAEYR